MKIQTHWLTSTQSDTQIIYIISQISSISYSPSNLGIWRQKNVKIKKNVISFFGADVTSDVGIHVNKGTFLSYLLIWFFEAHKRIFIIMFWNWNFYAYVSRRSCLKLCITFFNFNLFQFILIFFIWINISILSNLINCTVLWV